jgi:hypothetical protein
MLARNRREEFLMECLDFSLRQNFSLPQQRREFSRGNYYSNYYSNRGGIWWYSVGQGGMGERRNANKINHPDTQLSAMIRRSWNRALWDVVTGIRQDVKRQQTSCRDYDQLLCRRLLQ